MCIIFNSAVYNERVLCGDMDPDEALLSLGNPWRNPWQMMVYNIVIGSLGIVVSMHVMAIVFVGECALVPVYHFH